MNAPDELWITFEDGLHVGVFEEPGGAEKLNAVRRDKRGADPVTVHYVLAPTDVDETCRRYGWTWTEPEEFRASRLSELRDSAGELLGWISARPRFCDRGHSQAGVDAVTFPDLDAADGLPRYFMRRDTARQELVALLAWRIYKQRAEVL